MTTELDALVVSLRADTRRFRSDIAEARSALGDLEAMAQAPQARLDQALGTARDGSEVLSTVTSELLGGMEDALQRFGETGRLTFDDLRSAALSALSDILQAMHEGPFGGGGLFGSPGGGGLAGALVNTAFSFLGRAAGGPVAPSRPYIVGERGPELFVPRGAGEIVPGPAGGGPAQPINITVNVSGATANGGDASRSGTQIALAVRRALKRAERFA